MTTNGRTSLRNIVVVCIVVLGLFVLTTVPFASSSNNSIPSVRSTAYISSDKKSGEANIFAALEPKTLPATPSSIQETTDICLQDDSNGNRLSLNRTTGNYTFTKCGANGFTVSGTGVITTKGCLITLQHARTDGRVLAQADTCMNKGTASIQIFSQSVTYTIIDRNTVGSSCACVAECVPSSGVLTAGEPGVSLLNPTTLLSAIRIINTGSSPAQNVLVTSITLNGGTLTSPASLPFSLGTIPLGGSTILNAGFSGGPFNPHASFTLTVQGTFVVGAVTYCFTLTANLIIPPAAPGSAPVNRVTVEPNKVSGAPFPPHPPSFDDDVNKSRRTIPTGPFVPGTPTLTSTGTQTAPTTQTTLRSAASSIVFVKNNGLGVNGSNIAEPSGGSGGGGVVFISGNWFAAYSTDGGSSFKQLDPTTIFPNDAVGFCCDQIVQYVPSIDRVIWLLQGNGVRIASASPAEIISSGGTAWIYWNLTPDIFGQTGFDFPDLSVGTNSLYMSWDASGASTGYQVARTSLAGIQAGSTISIDYTNPSDSSMALFSHLSQNTQDEIFWAGHKDTSHMRVFSFAEGSGFYFWRDITISTWANDGFSSLTPDGHNWLADVRDQGTFISGATRVFNQIWFAWSAGTDSNFLQPHVEMVTLDRNDSFKVIQQMQIWNNSYAFAYPALATNACTSEVGLSLEYGGEGNFENHVVGFWGDFVVYITTVSNVGTDRYGDYVTIRQEPATNANLGSLFSAFGYGLNSVPPPGRGARTDVRYVLFGRPASSCAF
jgi:hypothetical protein